MLSCQWSSFSRVCYSSPFSLQQFNNKALNLNRNYCLTKSSMEDSSFQVSPSPFQFLTKKSYEPPQWASHLSPLPSHTFSLGHFPTPIHKWNLPNLPKDTEVWLKRDDISGMQLSGNKVRKLEFLLGDAVAQGADCIVTIGGIQSNHCRATAVAAKYLNLDCYLILRTSKLLVDKDPGLIGNLLVERLVGAHIDLVSKEEYAKVGSEALTKLLKEKLLNEGRKPYVIPVGGSNSLGTWGYIEAIREVEQQLQHSSSEWKFDDIVVACGSGGTVAGLSIASRLSGLKAKVNAFCVCDDPDYFYEYVQGLLDGNNAGVSSRDIVSIQNAKGLGYAMSTADELKFVKQVAEATGVILDPVYSGKAAYGMIKDMNENPTKWEGRKILFIHTGGLLGLYDKADEMASLMGKWRKMDINESIPRQDGIGKMF
ncbi:PREDICTED: bifunctional D-cysteine desulfhydrase/1-aminocyclopropane-1-carboxylate deaminase, mitochondrial isoform X1 [Nicotiana attenuata]|uniref:bifunctional D-cysteine desulfhydrase/1-aminocyclopropane-1-carboxylate deaminase, mitochondrial isoform X1 n=2 Tax=Nicotiana attenuata TaxID=49451 RepID=UPI0009055273|nr:PREDICTED: bifunctional D-cysteine desulfhydrase/1-aminocyclopropane-1-carboxylate deaminase, mitochondrial isoform X1 [Nicotiana attenuata]